MNLHITAESGTHTIAFLEFKYLCKKCGHINEATRLNPFNNAFITLNVNEPQYEMICHKCEDVEKFTMRLEDEVS